MNDRWLKRGVTFRHYRFVRASRRTLAALFPLALIGAVARVFEHNFFDDNGFIYNITLMYNWMPDDVLNFLHNIFSELSTVSFGVLGMFAAWLTAKYTAQLYNRDDTVAGIAGMAAMMLLAIRFPQNGTLNFEWRILSGKMLFIGLLVGYITGLLFHFWGSKQLIHHEDHAMDIQRRMFRNFYAVLGIIVIAMAINCIINLLVDFNVITTAYGALQDLSNGDQPAWIKAPLIIITTILEWLGMSGPYNVMNANRSAAINANMSYALLHHGGSVPYPYLGTTLYNSFGTFGGAGLCLALVIAVAIASRRRSDQQMVRWNMLPVLFNSNYGVMVGLPVILNPFLLLPFVFLPAINVGLATIMIALHLMPTPAFWVPTGTPGPLVAFMGTNGNWVALIFSLLLLAFDVWCYLPFVRLSFSVDARAHKLDKEAERHE